MSDIRTPISAPPSKARLLALDPALDRDALERQHRPPGRNDTVAQRLERSQQLLERLVAPAVDGQDAPRAHDAAASGGYFRSHSCTCAPKPPFLQSHWYVRCHWPSGR